MESRSLLIHNSDEQKLLVLILTPSPKVWALPASKYQNVFRGTPLIYNSKYKYFVGKAIGIWFKFEIDSRSTMSFYALGNRWTLKGSMLSYREYSYKMTDSNTIELYEDGFFVNRLSLPE